MKREAIDWEKKILKSHIQQKYLHPEYINNSQNSVTRKQPVNLKKNSQLESPKLSFNLG